MAIQAIAGGLFFPRRPPFSGTGALSFGTALIDANDEKAGCVIQIPKTGSVRKIGFLTQTVTTGATLDVRLETVSTASGGSPSGTLWGTNTNASQVVAAADDSVWFTTQLTADASVTQGDLAAIVISQPSSGAGNLNIARSADFFFDLPTSMLYTGTWSRGSAAPIHALEYSDGTYAPIDGVYPLSALSSAAINTGTTPDEIGIKFTLPFKARVCGCWGYFSGTAANFSMNLYDSDGTTVLASLAVDGDITTNSPRRLFKFSSPQTLLANTAYRLTILPATATSITVYHFTTATAAIMDAMDGGQNVHHTERTDAGAWSQTTTRRPWIGLMIDGLDDAASGSAGMLYQTSEG